MNLTLKKILDFLQNLEVCSLAKKELPSNRSVHRLHEDCEAIPDDVQRAKSEGYARSLLLLSLCLLIPLPELNASNKDPKVGQMVKTIFEDYNDKSRTYNELRRKQISEFAIKTAKAIASQNASFAENVLLEEDLIPGDIDLFLLDDKNILLVLTTYQHAYQRSGCLFIANKDKMNLTPISLDGVIDKNLTNSYSIVTDSIGYDSPILSIYTRHAGYFGGIGTSESYVFKEGALQHIRSLSHTLDDKKIEGVDTSGDDFSYEEYIIDDVIAWNKDISDLYKRFTSKESDDLKKDKNWENIYFIKTKKTHLHEHPDHKNQQKAYLVRGDALYVSEKKGSWGFANYLNPKTKKTASGWVKLKDLVNVDRI